MGGYGYLTILHEIGHGMGLAHPHDDGGSSTVMTGVTSAFGDTGSNGLNQGVYTVMTYNDGWFDGPDGSSNNTDYGFAGSLMALDIAVLQDTYGANTNTASGDDTYTLSDTNASGTFFTSIWDTGGTANVLTGLAGDDVLTGGAGADTFVFTQDQGSDTITDFENNTDRLEFTATSTVTDRDDLFGLASQDGDDVLFDLGGGAEIRVQSISVAAIENDIFVV